MGRLTFCQGQQFNGQPVRISFVVDSLPHDFNNETLYDAESLPGVSPCVRFARGVEAREYKIGQRVEAEGVIRTQIVPARGIGCERFEAVFGIEMRQARPITTP